jgi:putative membrane protein
VSAAALLGAFLAVACYGAGVQRLAARGDRWPVTRTLWFLVGVALITAALLPPLGDAPVFVLHVVGHLLLAMAGPAALALSAPVTLALRTLPMRARGVLLRAVHSRVARLLLLPPVVLVLQTGGMAAYFLTGLFGLAEQHLGIHLLVHAHMLAAGCLLAWFLIGRDPISPRPTTRTRVVVLVAASAGHDVLAKTMYAAGLPLGAGSLPQLHLGAEALFLGGDVLDLLLMTAVLAEWYARSGRELARQRRREALTSSPAA